MSNQYITALNCFTNETPMHIEVGAHNEYIKFSIGDGVKTWLTNPTMLMGGGTLGEENRKQLHVMLDNMLNANLEAKIT